jgi:hypothetical protein
MTKNGIEKSDFFLGAASELSVFIIIAFGISFAGALPSVLIYQDYH